MQISVVIPLFNEAESLPELMQWIDRVMQANNYSYEVIMVDDGSKDNSWNTIQTLRTTYPSLKGIKFQRNYGKSAALNEGFKMAKGDIVVTMDADLQDSPDEIPEFYDMITKEGYHLVSGWKKKRYDNTFTKNIPSKIYNAVARRSSGIILHDFNCGIKAYQLKVIKSIEVFGEMHRYIPILAKWAGFSKIGEKVVVHQARKYGTTKFGWERFVNGFLDLMTIQFLSKFGKKPMQFFGLIGSLFFLIGLVSFGNIVFDKFMNPDFSVTNKPAFYIALVSMIIGVQLFLAGFIAELVNRSAVDRNTYLIEDKLGFNS
ncbi:MAG: glycosyltransferase [Chitinophagia bacterium]|jgi:glycosyltransferase involved in cell wall biosynthesis|nr:glycosyltransferase [Chitinophagia bacterium]NCA30686.1 glycosyltransferase [Chitinophagia bacterium]NDD16943.1 glycosyltransferase [Chitinophagia bacterium]